MPQNPACFSTDSSTATAAVAPLPDDPDSWRSTCNCRDANGEPTVTCASGTYDEAYDALLLHRGETVPAVTE